MTIVPVTSKTDTVYGCGIDPPARGFFYVMQTLVSCARRRRLAAVAVLLQREVAVPTGRRLAVVVLLVLVVDAASVRAQPITAVMPQLMPQSAAAAG